MEESNKLQTPMTSQSGDIFQDFIISQISTSLRLPEQLIPHFPHHNLQNSQDHNLQNSQEYPYLIPGLPEHIAALCLARLPRNDLNNLKGVSEHWRTTIDSVDFFRLRLERMEILTQHSLYLNIRQDTSFNWYQLRIPKNPCNETLIPKTETLMKEIPSIPFQRAGPAYAVVGPKIYVLGGSVNDVATTDVCVLDSRVNEWVEGPRMKVRRQYAGSGVVGDEVYVLGGCLDNLINRKNWAEKLDQNADVWTPVSSDQANFRTKWMRASAVIDGRIYVKADMGVLVYDVGSRVWETVANNLASGWSGCAAAVKDVLYSFNYSGNIIWYDMEKEVWKELIIVENWLPNFSFGAKMLDLGGRLCVVWEQASVGNGVDVWCAVFEVGKDEDGGFISGKILWEDAILWVPDGSSISHCMAVAL